MSVNLNAGGEYGDDGEWRTLKHCFAYCGSNCNCQPPGGLHYNPAYDKNFEKKTMTDKEYCPRSLENGGGPDSTFKPPMNGEMTWREDDGSCSYCGSVNPDVLMARLEKGDISVIPTDKNYKLYIQNEGGEEFKQSYRNCPPDAECSGPEVCTHWVTRDHPQPKFYFQHFSVEQKMRFIELLNSDKLKIGRPGYFYRTPYFMSKEKENGSS